MWLLAAGCLPQIGCTNLHGLSRQDVNWVKFALLWETLRHLAETPNKKIFPAQIILKDCKRVGRTINSQPFIDSPISTPELQKCELSNLSLQLRIKEPPAVKDSPWRLGAKSSCLIQNVVSGSGCRTAGAESRCRARPRSRSGQGLHPKRSCSVHPCGSDDLHGQSPSRRTLQPRQCRPGRR